MAEHDMGYAHLSDSEIVIQTSQEESVEDDDEDDDGVTDTTI